MSNTVGPQMYFKGSCVWCATTSSKDRPTRVESPVTKRYSQINPIALIQAKSTQIQCIQIYKPGTSGAPSGPLPGTFLGPALDIRSEYLYELGSDIPDLMGLRALMPDAEAVKVMSVIEGQSVYPGCDPGRPRDVWLPRDTATRYRRRGIAVRVTQ